MNRKYHVGQAVRVRNEFTDDLGALYNPTTTTLKIEAPDGIETSFTGGQLTSPGTGVFYRDVQATAPGTWRWRWEGSGPSGKEARDEGFYIVSRSTF